MLKLDRLPDRTPTKITISVGADLNQALTSYATLYRATYGEAESVSELIPYMLAAFLDSDRAFTKVRKRGTPAAETGKSQRRPHLSRSEPPVPLQEE